MEVIILSPLKSSIIEKLTEIVGGQYISTDDADLVSYSSDFMIDVFLKPDVVILPENTHQISEIVKLANKNNIAITPRGAGTATHGGSIAQEGILLDLTRMNKIIEFDPVSMIAVVEPGVVYEDLNRVTGKMGLWFPIEPPSGAVCTIGGMVGNNASGLMALKYGTTKDYILALEVILADGSVIKTGKSVLKSSSGYDLVHLFVGSEGTLGIITEATVRLIPQPMQISTAFGSFQSLNDAMEAIYEIRRILTPAGIELIDLQTQKAINDLEKEKIVPEVEALIIFEIHEFSVAGLEDKKDVIEWISSKHNCIEMKWAKNDEERERMWKARKAATVVSVRSRTSTLLGDLIVPIKHVPVIIRFIQDVAKEKDLLISIVGHAADGNIHYLIPFNQDESKNAFDAADEIVYKTLELGGSVTAEHGIGFEKIKYMEREHGESLNIMKAIKKILDPKGILNPGKIFPIET
jgi:glycolate oxidase